MSSYRTVIEQTTQTIDNRAKYYRNLIVVVVLIGLFSTAWALFSWSLLPLSGIVLLLPACGVFFFFDAKLLNAWRDQLFQSWIRKEIDFYYFCEAITANPLLPKETLKGMLATLPMADNIISEQAISSNTRRAITESVKLHYVHQADVLAFKAAIFAILAVLLLFALGFEMWQPLLGAIVIVIFPYVQKLVKQIREKKVMEMLLIVQQHPDYNQDKYIELVSAFEWWTSSET